MAQGSKSRVVIWAIVGILVLVAAGMLLFGKKEPTTIPIRAEDVPTFTKKMNRWLDAEAKDAVELRAAYGESEAATFAQFDATMEKARATLAEMQTLTDDKELGIKRDESKKYLSELKELLKPFKKKK